MLTPFVFVLSCLAPASQGDHLSLDQALKLGKDRNATIQSALHTLEAARQRVTLAKAAFFPSVTLDASYQDSKVTDYTLVKPNRTTLLNSGTSASANAAWTLLDTGERITRLEQFQASYRSEEFSSLQTLRGTLVTIYTQYLDAVRSQELEKVSQAEVERAKKVYEQAVAQAKYGAAAEKDTLQPHADELNAEVNLLSSQNQSFRTKANLKATIGMTSADTLPLLDPIPSTVDVAGVGTDSEEVAYGLANRADLQSQRQQVASLHASYEQARIASGLTFAFDVNASRRYLANNQYQPVASLNFSYPLFDGGALRAAARAAKSTEEASALSLKQSELQAQSDILANLNDLRLYAKTVDAAKAALDAAQVNFDKTFRARQLGAAGVDAVTLSTAQVTLVTAQTNLIQAQYNYAVAYANYRLLTGRTVPGETQ
ncbi:MAG: TolC family protein [Armatimonadetes bacterium]|nr:TolC family protein [Armatimonadota bacterium]